MLNPKLLVEAFPLNKVEVFFDDLDHSNFLGFTWERIAEGKFPVGYNPNDADYNQIGATGGEKEHTLTIDEMPSHQHELSLANYGSEKVSAVVWSNQNSQKFAYAFDMINSKGGDQPHENRPPYIVMAFWKRIA